MNWKSQLTSLAIKQDSATSCIIVQGSDHSGNQRDRSVDPAFSRLLVQTCHRIDLNAVSKLFAKTSAAICATIAVFMSTATLAKPDLIGISAAGGEFGYNKVEPELELNGVIQHTLDRGPYAYVYPSQAYVEYFVTELGMTAIRIGTRWERLQENPNVPIPADSVRLQELVDAVNRVTDAGAYAIVDIHNYGKFVSIDASGNQVETNVGDGPVTNQHFANLWQRLAETFKNNDKVMFELTNEPNRQDQAKLMITLQAGINAIRATGATNSILVPGNRWSGAHSWNDSDQFGESNNLALLAIYDPLDKLIFVAHQYVDSNFSGTSPDCLSENEAVAKLDIFTAWLRDNSRRGLLGEFGVSSDSACVDTLDAMLAHIDENSDVYAGAIYWATGDYWQDIFYLIRPAILKDGQTTDHGAAQLEVIKTYLTEEGIVLPGKIIDQNSTNAWYIPGNGTRAWINQECANHLESEGMERISGNWNDDLAHLTGYSVNCDDIEIPDITPPPPPPGEVLDQDATNAWYLPGDGRRAWINQACADELESGGMSRRSGSWNDDLASLTGYSVNCSDISTTPIIDLPPPPGEVLDQSATNAWYLPGDGTRAWINQACADQLEDDGMPRRSGNWNDDLAQLTGFSVSCGDI